MIQIIATMMQWCVLKCVSVHGAVAMEEKELSHMPCLRIHAKAPLLAFLSHHRPIMVLHLHLKCLHVYVTPRPPPLHLHASFFLHEHPLQNCLLSLKEAGNESEDISCERHELSLDGDYLYKSSCKLMHHQGRISLSCSYFVFVQKWF